MTAYQPPLTLTPRMLALVANIGEQLGRLSVVGESRLTPHLRRGNRIRTIQASLAIENNTLSLEQVTAVLDGKKVLGLPKEIQEVRNAFTTYEAMSGWHPAARKDLLQAHRLLMLGLIDDAGRLRTSGVGIYRADQLLHMAPPPSRVAHLVDQLLMWLKHTDLHPLIASCVFHYEFEFIHPFADGNGRMGRLWQTLILSQWHPVLAYLPVETVIREQQTAYYAALAASDQVAEATPFVEFMLQALSLALDEVAFTTAPTAQVTEQVTAQVKRLLFELQAMPDAKANELMSAVGLSHRQSFRERYLGPALAAGWVEMSNPASPRSPLQTYRLTAKGSAQLG